jgi:molecular chaperone GrpE
MSDKKHQQPSVEDLQSQLEAALSAQQVAEEAHKRALADYKNLEFRTRQERGQIIKRACADLLSDLIPTLDNLDMALQHFSDPSLKMVAAELNNTLERHGLSRLQTVGSTFDPHTMEAIDTAAGNKDEVIREQRSGYKLADSVLRPASVVVGNGQTADTTAKNNTENS